MSKEIHCGRCLDDIKVRSDLVTATSIIDVIPYHEECYTKELKSINTIFIDNHPINGFSGNTISIFAIFFFIGTTIYSISSGILLYLLLSAIFLIPIIYRTYSYFKYERHIEK